MSCLKGLNYQHLALHSYILYRHRVSFCHIERDSLRQNCERLQWLWIGCWVALSVIETMRCPIAAASTSQQRG